MSEAPEPESAAAAKPQEWQLYVWLDKAGEPRSIHTRGERAPEGEYSNLSQYSLLPVESDISGYPPRGDALFFAEPFRVYRNPIPSMQGTFLLCHIVDSSGDGQYQEAMVAREALATSDGRPYPYEHLATLAITQQFYLTSKFVPISFATNPPKMPGPFGSGVGGDLAVGRATVHKAAAWLRALGVPITTLTPLATPSHWGITLEIDTSVVSEDAADQVMLLRFLVAKACEESNLTPAFITKLLIDPWPSSLLKITARTRTDSKDPIALGKRLQGGHESLMRAVSHVPGAAVGGGPVDLEVAPYQWAQNAKAGVIVTPDPVGCTWLVDSRIPSSANPYVAFHEWTNSWIQG